MRENNQSLFLAGEYLKQEGYVTNVYTAVGDKAVDMFAEADGKRYVVQIKTYNGRYSPIDCSTVMELHNAMQRYECQAAILLCNSLVKDEAVNMASQLDIRLIYFDPVSYEYALKNKQTDIQYFCPMDVYTTLEDYKSYYGSLEFQRDLLRYFQVFPGFTGRPYPWIGSVSHMSNPSRKEGCPSSIRSNNFYFSFCLFFHSLQAQSIFILSGREMMDRYHTETLVPMIVCGMGGVMHPAHILLEAGLLPEGDEIPEYIKMIDKILPAIKAQVEKLKAYGDTDKLYSFMKEEIIRFRNRLESGRPHPGYLIEGI